MDANAWALVEDEENAEEEEAEGEGEEAGDEESRIDQQKQKSGANLEETSGRWKKSGMGTSRSGSSVAGRGGSDVLVEELDETRSEPGAGEGELSAEGKKRKKSRSKSPAVESFRQFGKLMLDKMKRKRSEPAQLLSRTHELPHCQLEKFCRKPREWEKRKRPALVSGELLESQRRKREKCAHLFRAKDHSHLADALSGADAPVRVHLYDPYCPVHGSRRRLRFDAGGRGQRRLLDMQTFFASVDTAVDEDVDEKLNPYLHSQAIAAKQFRKERRAIMRETEGPKLEELKRGIATDLLVISLAFLLLFTGFNGLQTLQTSVNGDMGADSLCVLYLCLAISTLFVPSFILNRLGCKRTLVIGIGLHVLYFSANFIPRYYSLIPASIVAGMSASCVWASKCVYITESAIKYAKLNVESTVVVIPRFFGYFFMFYHMGQVLGNVLSSLILGSAIQRLEPEDRVDYTCGHSFFTSNLSDRALHNLSPPPRLAFLAVIGMNLCCAIFACVTVKWFLNPLQKQATIANSTKAAADNQPAKFSAPIFRLTLRNLRKPKPDLLIPLTIFNGIEQAFAIGLYTKAYVACGLGISEIGFVMTSFGVADAICSLVFGPLIKLFGRMPLLMFGAVINVLMIITLMIWVVNPGDRALFNAIAGVWGMADGVWNTQLNGFWVALLGPGRDQLEVAFASYRFWMSFGLAFGFFLIRVSSIDTFLLIAFAFLLMGILGYFLVELFEIIAMRLEREEEEMGRRKRARKETSGGKKLEGIGRKGEVEEEGRRETDGGEEKKPEEEGDDRRKK